MPPPEGFTRRTASSDDDTRQNETPQPGFTRRTSSTPQNAPTRHGFARRAPQTLTEPHRPSARPASRPKQEEAPQSPSAKQRIASKPAKRKSEINWVDDEDELQAVSLGEVTVIGATDKAIWIQGGETIGEHWIPRSQIFKKLSKIDRRNGGKGDVGELWVSQWLADKIPW